MAILITVPTGSVGLPLRISTNQDSVVLSGTAGSEATVVQVKVGSADWTSEGGIVDFSAPTFTVPDPVARPDGLALVVGSNEIGIRTKDAWGHVSATGTVTVTRVLDSGILSVPSPPTGTKVYRHIDSVEVSVVASPSANVVGYNFYASQYPGGGTAGYLRVNQDTVTVSSETETSTEVLEEATATSSAVTAYRVRIGTETVGLTGPWIYDDVLDAGTGDGDVSVNLSLVREVATLRYAFDHSRSSATGTLNSDIFGRVSSDQPLYYVSTAVAWDSVNGSYTESGYGAEVAAAPLIVDRTIRGLTPQSFDDIVVRIIDRIRRTETGKNVGLQPGSVPREVRTDPFASEAERLHFIADFVHRCGSVVSLLQVDDTNGDGVTDPVSGSVYKLALKAALKATSDDDVQGILDGAFERLAADRQIFRLPAQKARGRVRFFAERQPSSVSAFRVDAGTTVVAQSDSTSAAATYVVTGGYNPSGDVDDYYNPEAGVWEIPSLSAVAAVAGSDGNRAPGQIRRVTRGPTGLKVTNDDWLTGGTGVETNSHLAERTILAQTSVDTGTPGGYEAVAVGTGGVERANVVGGGHALMKRDWDDVRGVHTGGKVDVWIVGEEERVREDAFSFSPAEIAGARFWIIGDPADLLFEVQDARLTAGTPLTIVSALRDVSKIKNFVLTGYTLPAYNRVQLDPLAAGQVFPAADDVVSGTVLYREQDRHVFAHQPARRVLGVSGEVIGDIPTSTYVFYRRDDPLLLGVSTRAEDAVAFSGVAVTIVSESKEQKVVLGTVPVSLAKLGIYGASVRVYGDAGGTVLYALGTDYTLDAGTSTTRGTVARTALGAIPDGSLIYVDYDHDENFVASYVTNGIVENVAARVDVTRHTTADVAVKEVILVPLNIEATVLPDSTILSSKDPSSRTRLDLAIRASVAGVFSALRPGQDVSQSDVISAVDRTVGVSSLTTPLHVFCKASGTVVPRELVHGADTVGGFVYLGGESSALADAYLITAELSDPPVDGGGTVGDPAWIFVDEEVLIRDGVTVPGEVGEAPWQGWIIGAEGASLVGYSDDATLAALGFATEAARQAERVLRTANRALISLPPGQTPLGRLVEVTYVTAVSTSQRTTVAIRDVEKATVGRLTFLYAEA